MGSENASEYWYWVVLWAIFWGGIAYNIGHKKGDGARSFIAGCLLGPLGVLIVAVSNGNRVQCPFCRERIDPEAVVCAHCQRDIPPRSTPSRMRTGRLYTDKPDPTPANPAIAAVLADVFADQRPNRDASDH